MKDLRTNRSVHCAIAAIKGQTQVSPTLIRDGICLSADASRTLTVTCGGWHKPTSEMAWWARRGTVQKDGQVNKSAHLLHIKLHS